MDRRISVLNGQEWPERSTMIRFLSLSALLLLFVAQATAQSLHYQWLNQPCANNLNCSEGCSACDMPDADDPNFFGTTMVWIGVPPPCPHPVIVGDNAVYTSDWPVFAMGDHYGMLSAISLTELQIDSVIIRHRRNSDGPERLKVSVNQAASQPVHEVADVEVLTSFTNTIITDVGCMEIPDGAPYGTFQLMVQPYQGAGGSWHIDEVRIVASPCEQLSIGIEEYQRTQQRTGTLYDVLGRPVGANAAPGVYSGQRKVVQVL